MEGDIKELKKGLEVLLKPVQGVNKGIEGLANAFSDFALKIGERSQSK